MRLDPSLTGQLSGIVLRGLSWRGRQFTVSIGQRTTTVTVTAGRNLVLVTPLGRRVVNARRALVLPTRRPDIGAHHRRGPLRPRIRVELAAGRATARGGRRQRRDRLAAGDDPGDADGARPRRRPAGADRHDPLGPAVAAGARTRTRPRPPVR